MHAAHSSLVSCTSHFHETHPNLRGFHDNEPVRGQHSAKIPRSKQKGEEGKTSIDFRETELEVLYMNFYLYEVHPYQLSILH